jgi:protein gp37
MGDKSAIEWTEATWNPVTGCTKISPGCSHCYAERLALRLRKMGNPRYTRGFDLTLHPDQIDLPMRWKRPRRIFVNSMSDLFHEDIPEEFIRKVFRTMNLTRRHQFQILTKRAGRLRALAPSLDWTPNIWQGVSVEDAAHTDRIEALARVPARVRFLSVEPLLGPIPNLPLGDVDWVIVGGESGPAHRPVEPEWIREIRDQCQAAGVPFFFKQWGGATSRSGGHTLDGRVWLELPRGASPDGPAISAPSSGSRARG